MNHLNLYTCPYCPDGKSSIKLETAKLPVFSGTQPEKQVVELNDPLTTDAVTFGGKTTACEHLFDMEMFLNRGIVGNDGVLETNWSARFAKQSPMAQELDPDGFVRDFLYEEIYLCSEALNQSEYRLVVPHVVTGWIDYRFQRADRQGWWDLQFHGIFTEDVTLFFHEMNRLASVRQERWRLKEEVC